MSSEHSCHLQLNKCNQRPQKTDCIIKHVPLYQRCNYLDQVWLWSSMSGNKLDCLWTNYFMSETRLWRICIMPIIIPLVQFNPHIGNKREKIKNKVMCKRGKWGEDRCTALCQASRVNKTHNWQQDYTTIRIWVIIYKLKWLVSNWSLIIIITPFMVLNPTYCILDKTCGQQKSLQNTNDTQMIAMSWGAT